MAESKRGYNSANSQWNINISILLQAVLNEYRVNKVFILAIMAESKKGHYLVNILKNLLKS